MVAYIPLETNLFFLINIPQPISSYQLNTMPEVDIPILHCELKTASLFLSLLLFLLTLLPAVCSWIFWPEQNISHVDYNHEFQSKIDLFLEFKFLSQIKTKGRPPNAQNKRFNIEADLGENSTWQNSSKFEYDIDQCISSISRECLH